MPFPTLIDLKGEVSVPDTVIHVVVTVDPRSDMSWNNLKKHIPTDGVHARDRQYWSQFTTALTTNSEPKNSQYAERIDYCQFRIINRLAK